MSGLRVRGLAKSFGAVPVLRGVDLDVPDGTVAAVLGPSGEGKTTLLRCIAGFEAADAGQVEVGGRLLTGDGVSVAPERRRVGVVPQEGALFPHLDVAGNVGFGLPRSARRSGRVEEVLALVGLDGYGPRLPHELSGGQQQRVALARALAPRPSLVLLDEPFSALDAGLRAALREDVRAALRAAGTTGVLVTHDQDEALSVADLVAVLREGRVVQAASPFDLYHDPVDLGVATFVGEAVVLEAEVAGGAAATPLGRLPVRGARPDGCGSVVVRPEQLRLLPSGEGLPATVLETVFYGHDAVVRLRLDTAGGLAVAARGLHVPHLSPGDRVGVAVEGDVTAFPRVSTPTVQADSSV